MILPLMFLLSAFLQSADMYYSVQPTEFNIYKQCLTYITKLPQRYDLEKNKLNVNDPEALLPIEISSVIAGTLINHLHRIQKIPGTHTTKLHLSIKLALQLSDEIAIQASVATNSDYIRAMQPVLATQWLALTKHEKTAYKQLIEPSDVFAVTYKTYSDRMPANEKSKTLKKIATNFAILTFYQTLASKKCRNNNHAFISNES